MERWFNYINNLFCVIFAVMGFGCIITSNYMEVGTPEQTWQTATGAKYLALYLVCRLAHFKEKD